MTRPRVPYFELHPPEKPFNPITYSALDDLRYYDKFEELMRGYTHQRVISPRDIGKSYEALCDAVERAIIGHATGQPNHQTMYMRRGQEELDEVLPVLLDDIFKEFPDFEFELRKRTWYVRPLTASDDRKAWRPVIVGQALRTSGKKRSTPFPNISHILFDEFIDDGNDKINDEANLFTGFYKTINRGGQRKGPVKTLFLANPPLTAAGISNPFLTNDGIRVSEEMPEFIPLKNKSTIYWFPRPGVYGNQTKGDFERMVEGTEYGDMALSGLFTGAYGRSVGKRGTNAWPVCGILMGRKNYSIWEDEAGVLFAERKAPKTPDLPWYAMSPRDIRPGVVLLSRTNDATKRAVKYAIASGGMVYEDAALFDELIVIATA